MKTTALHEKPSPFDRLADNEQIFVLEYLSSFNATRAAIKAGSSPASAAQTGYRMLRKVHIQEALQEEQRARAEALRMDQRRLLEEEAVIAFFDPAELFHPKTGELLPPNKLPEYVRRNLQSMDINREERREGEQTVVTTKFRYKFGDKGRSLERLAKHLGLFSDSVRLEVVENFQNTILELLGELGPDVARTFREKLMQKRESL